MEELLAKRVLTGIMAQIAPNLALVSFLAAATGHVSVDSQEMEHVFVRKRTPAQTAPTRVHVLAACNAAGMVIVLKSMELPFVLAYAVRVADIGTGRTVLVVHLVTSAEAAFNHVLDTMERKMGLCAVDTERAVMGYRDSVIVHVKTAGQVNDARLCALVELRTLAAVMELANLSVETAHALKIQ
eukprot:PhF_6_TR26720/c0_g1_i1/m.39120